MKANKVAQHLDISVVTLGNWYSWYRDLNSPKPSDTPILPEYKQPYTRGPRYWASDDMESLEKFKAWIPKGRAGVMGKTNSKYWGERGKRANKNRI